MLAFDWKPGFILNFRFWEAGNCLLWIANAKLLRFLDRAIQLDIPSQYPAEVTEMASTGHAL